MIAYKATDVETEIEDAKNAINILGGKLDKVVKLDSKEFERNLIFIKKIKKTDKKYPRNGNKPRISPIIWFKWV